MRTTIPSNAVKIDYINVLNHFISLLAERQKDNIRCIYLSGSYARGDAIDISDLDVFCIFNALTVDVLQDVGFAARHMAVPYEQLEINAQCLSFAELTNDDFKNWAEKPARILDSVLVYGEDIFGNDISIMELRSIYKRYFTDILMGIRHYLCVDEPVEKLTHKKIKTYILKPLMFPLRMERCCVCGTFPLTLQDLKNSLRENDRFIIDYFLDETSFNEAIHQNHTEVLNKIYDVIMRKLQS
ncbi:MAG: nucleotidyltransferase domain-containing protein [Oscillospiraceae bacterium]|nr:nucleotidyltransferase domain-containing protein [Oscillospiraceae bacterium]